MAADRDESDARGREQPTPAFLPLLPLSLDDAPLLHTMTSDLSSLLFWLSSFWGALYLLRQYRRRTAAAGRLLPAPSAVGSSTSLELLKTRTTRIALKNCHLSLSSTAWNATHQRTTARLRRRGQGALALAYDAGSVLGVLGMVGAVVLLAWTAAGALGGVVDGYMASHEMKVSPGRLLSERKLGKRDWDDAGPATEAEGNSGSAPLQLIVSNQLSCKLDEEVYLSIAIRYHLIISIEDSDCMTSPVSASSR